MNCYMPTLFSDTFVLKKSFYRVKDILPLVGLEGAESVMPVFGSLEGACKYVSSGLVGDILSRNSETFVGISKLSFLGEEDVGEAGKVFEPLKVASYVRGSAYSLESCLEIGEKLSTELGDVDSGLAEEVAVILSEALPGYQAGIRNKQRSWFSAIGKFIKSFVLDVVYCLHIEWMLGKRKVNVKAFAPLIVVQEVVLFGRRYNMRELFKSACPDVGDFVGFIAYFKDFDKAKQWKNDCAAKTGKEAYFADITIGRTVSATVS